ncbi:MAG TPA: hypothetical protein VD931_15550, partial [Baekduia sp.]|nr:hypothetical protein [Baekduia sp.]
MTRRAPGWLALAGAALVALPATAAAQGAPPTTSTTVVTGDAQAAYGKLRLGPGWKRVVRDDLAAAQRGRSVRRRSLLYAVQLSDFQLADEESPVRVETLDLQSTPFTSAWRPQEALTPHTVDQVVRTVNRLRTSPIRTQRRSTRKGRRRTLSAPLAMVLTTGDSTDNQQTNEVEWVVRLLEGGRLHPNSGAESTTPCAAGPVPAGEAARYTGVQDRDDVPESAGFYDPDAPAGAFAAFPRYPGLMDRAQQPFDTPGLAVPSYVAFGNHDGVVQGNVAANALYDALVQGCVKPLNFQPPLLSTFLATEPGRAVAVPPDRARAFASRPRYMELHRTGRQADAHGFGHVDPAEAKASNGWATYYAFSPRPGLRFISINTVGEGSNLPGSEGNLDDPQFRWLARELRRADERGELAVVFGHHPIRSLLNRDPDEDARPCADPTSGPGCDGDPRSSRPIRLGPDLQRLLLEHRSAIAYVAGHTHEHRITPFKREGGGGFWGIETASEIDWPIQSRLLEVFDNRDGTLSLFGTVIDHAGPVQPPAPGSDASAFGVPELAAIARELSFNDPQVGAPGGEGRPQDRNVELLLDDPRR